MFLQIFIKQIWKNLPKNIITLLEKKSLYFRTITAISDDKNTSTTGRIIRHRALNRGKIMLAYLIGIIDFLHKKVIFTEKGWKLHRKGLEKCKKSLIFIWNGKEKDEIRKSPKKDLSFSIIQAYR